MVAPPRTPPRSWGHARTAPEQPSTPIGVATGAAAAPASLRDQQQTHGSGADSPVLDILFVAAWAALGFGDALLCLIVAAVFYLATAIYRDELDLAELPPRSQPRASRASR